MKKERRGFNLASKPTGDGVWNAWHRQKVGGFISVGVPSVGTSDAVIVPRVGMHQSMRQQLGIP